MPYIRDLILAATSRPEVEDTIFVLTNADSCTARGIRELLINEFANTNEKLVYSHRRNFNRWPKTLLSVDDIRRRGEEFIGIDLVAFDWKWWIRQGVYTYPDLVLGCEGWDWVFKFWPGAHRIRDCIYHEYHYPPYWMANRTCPAELWNKARCLEWVESLEPEYRRRVEFDWPTLDEYRTPDVRVKRTVLPDLR